MSEISTDRVDAVITAETSRLVDRFKDLHRNPELGFTEVRTARIVAQTLADLDFTVTTGIGRTGVVAMLENGFGPTVMYRADMDALAVSEATGVDYASTARVTRDDGTSAPVAHVCGHDAHVVWMLGMAQVLARCREDWSGTAVLVGQPAEELIAGAQAMVDDNLYAVAPRPDALLALHTAPIPVGMVAAVGGQRMAGSDHLDVVFHGVGGHASMPQLAKDPVLMAAMAVVEFQSIVSRVITPQEAAVLTVGAIRAGSDYNVIPDRAELKLNLRWFAPHVREQLLTAIRSISEGIAHGQGLGAGMAPKIILGTGATPLVNDERLTARVAAALRPALGEQNVVEQFPAITGSEDCHLLKGPHTDVPLAYLLAGVADPAVYAEAAAAGKLIPYAPHSPEYLVDLAAIPFGTKVASHAMLELLDGGPSG